jgi:murein DD-endopeptidase MepM/ murein hydrolase activator NlpD
MTELRAVRRSFGLFMALGLIGLSGCYEAAASRKDSPGVHPKAAAPRVSATAASPVRVEFIWPTPNQAFAEGREIAAFIQPTASGEPRSGLFGSVRSGGRQFHEGLDILPVSRDRKGEPLDAVGASLAGVVRYVSQSAGNSNYGRYVVLEHPQMKPAIYTLYAHLRDVTPGMHPGRAVAAGERLGTMGHTSSGTGIPRERSHLHFEVGVRVTDQFNAWYARRGFGNPNPHGIWNGMNLAGVDPLELFTLQKNGGLRSLEEFFDRLPAAVTLRIARATEPDFVRRYPELVEQTGTTASSAASAGWEITVNATGLPFRWRRLGAADLVGFKTGEVRIMKADAGLLAANRGRKLAVQRGDRWVLGDDLETILEQAFDR